MLFTGEQPHGVTYVITQPHAPLPVVRHDLPAHARIPEFPEMACHILRCLRTIRFRAKEVADVIGHLDQAFDVHARNPLREEPVPVSVDDVLPLARKSYQRETALLREPHGERSRS